MIFSENEWDPLRSVVVGTAQRANWPTTDTVFREHMDNSPWNETEFRYGPVEENIIQEAEEDLNNFAEVLQSEGVIVHRPLPRDYQALDQFYGYCPRDTVLIIGDRVVRTPTVYPSRRNEWETLLHVWSGHPVYSVDDPAAIFDAANICRLGKDLLYLESISGNLAGAEWLQKFLGNDYRVHVIDSYGGVHIDSTVSPVREGLVILNKDRISPNTVPKPLKSWDKIWIGKKDIKEQTFTHYPYASNYIALNVLSIRPDLVAVDPNQEYLREQLSQHGINTVPIPLHHSRTLGGGHHCVTLDVYRSTE